MIACQYHSWLMVTVWPTSLKKTRSMMPWVEITHQTVTLWLCNSLSETSSGGWKLKSACFACLHILKGQHYIHHKTKCFSRSFSSHNVMPAFSHSTACVFSLSGSCCTCITWILYGKTSKLWTVLWSDLHEMFSSLTIQTWFFLGDWTKIMFYNKPLFSTS
jgi:hypothetical protein